MNAIHDDGSEASLRDARADRARFCEHCADTDTCALCGRDDRHELALDLDEGSSLAMNLLGAAVADCRRLVQGGPGGRLDLALGCLEQCQSLLELARGHLAEVIAEARERQQRLLEECPRVDDYGNEVPF